MFSQNGFVGLNRGSRRLILVLWLAIVSYGMAGSEVLRQPSSRKLGTGWWLVGYEGILEGKIRFVSMI